MLEYPMSLLRMALGKKCFEVWIYLDLGMPALLLIKYSGNESQKSQNSIMCPMNV